MASNCHNFVVCVRLWYDIENARYERRKYPSAKYEASKAVILKTMIFGCSLTRLGVI